MKKNNSEKKKASIVKFGENDVIILLESDGKEYKIGQKIMATVPVSRKTGRGRWANIAEVVAQGTVTNVEGKKITIDSKRNRPIISPMILKKAWEEKLPINIKEVSNVFYGQ